MDTTVANVRSMTAVIDSLNVRLEFLGASIRESAEQVFGAPLHSYAAASHGDDEGLHELILTTPVGDSPSGFVVLNLSDVDSSDEGVSALTKLLNEESLLSSVLEQYGN